MSRRQIVKLPEGMNPTRLLSVKEAGEISGISIWKLYKWNKKNIGMPTVKVKDYDRINIPAGLFVRWLNLRIETV